MTDPTSDIVKIDIGFYLDTEAEGIMLIDVGEIIQAKGLTDTSESRAIIYAFAEKACSEIGYEAVLIRDESSLPHDDLDLPESDHPDRYKGHIMLPPESLDEIDDDNRIRTALEHAEANGLLPALAVTTGITGGERELRRLMVGEFDLTVEQRAKLLPHLDPEPVFSLDDIPDDAPAADEDEPPQ